MNTPQTMQVTTPTDCEIVVTRTFDAPRALVFDAFTKPELLLQWFHGPEGWTLTVCDVDLRVGGSYRYVWQGPDGTGMGISGVFSEVDRPVRYAATETFEEPWYPGEALTTMVFAEHDGGTLITMTILYQSREARDIALSSGMEEGMAVGFDRLAEFLVTAAA